MHRNNSRPVEFARTKGVEEKMWRRAPESRIAPYKNCERPTEFKSRVTHSDFNGHGSHIPQKTALNQQTTVDQS